ncbi:MAG: UDP-N-acetylmuramoyl-tripeptide--D-alanyl-D-alanine ligase [Alphaproteobacteria bacterium]|nr:UDP-N-acetylmuramoyl-tripeptide--D-alanyl-D-alanine ligase [Alphaproteobacteria bacterium]
MNEALWLAEDAATATGGRLVGADSWIASGVSIDTRSLARGDLFVALKDQRDGHAFVADAFARGAAAALVSDADAAAPHGPALVVPDVLEALRCLGEAARDRSNAVRIAVTGSVGKTSTKEALALALRACAPTHASVKSYNNHWGVPLTLSRLPRSARYAVFEIGMNHRGEIRPLSMLAAPRVALITWIAPAHIEHLGSIEAIAEEKGDIFAGLGPDGAAIVPNEAPAAHLLLSAAENNAGSVIRFGREAGCEARLLRFEMTEDGAVAEADILGRQIRYRIGAPGAHWALNSVAALAAADVAGADVFAAAHALADLRAIEGRGVARTIERPGGAFTLIDDAYNANPTSMAAALETLGARAGARRIAVLGDMLELGADELAYHAGLAAPIVSAGVDLVFCAGPRMRALYEALPAGLRGAHAETADALAPIVSGAVQAGDAVLVKGSNGSRMRIVVDALTQSSQG